MEVNFQFQLVLFLGTVYEAQILRDDLVEDETSNGRLDDTSLRCAIRHRAGYSYFDTGMQGNNLVLVCKNRLVDALECHALALGARTFLGQIVDTEYHILGRNGYRTTIGRF